MSETSAVNSEYKLNNNGKVYATSQMSLFYIVVCSSFALMTIVHFLCVFATVADCKICHCF